jgi:hypothetical protein
MITFSEYCLRRGINEFSEISPEEVSSVDIFWSELGAQADFEVGGQSFHAMFGKEWHDLTSDKTLSGYSIMLRGPKGFESTGVMGAQGQMVYRQMILATMNVVRNAPKDHPAEFFSWKPYESKMQLVYMKMYERYMKRDWVMLKPGMAVNRQALMMSMSDKDIQKFQKTIEKTQIDVQNQILSLRNMRRSDANLRRQGLKPQQTLSKTKK